MERKKQKLIPLACRFVPFDQWFITHVDPTWKIKHLKQIILAKCLALPFDPRQLAREAAESGARRPPSPITFAPDESQRPASPVQFITPRELRKKRSMGVAFTGYAQGLSGIEPDSEGSASAEGGRRSGSAEGGDLGADGDLEGFGEEGYDEDDEWDDDEDSAPVGGGLVGPAAAGKRSSVVMGGRVQVPGVATAWAASPPIGSTPASSSAAIPTSPTKIRKKFNPLAKIAASSFNTSTSAPAPPAAAPPDPSPSTALVVYQGPQNPESKQIYTGFHTLVRFSTSQILEEDIPVSWYDLLPHELVELHASVLPLSFAMSVRIPQHLLNPTEMLRELEERDAQLLEKVKAASKSKGRSNANSNANANEDQSTPPQALSSALTLVALQRHDPKVYAQPYWEGWVRALRFISRSEIDRKAAPGASTAPSANTHASSSAAASSKSPGGGSYPHHGQQHAMGMASASASASGNLAGGLFGALAGEASSELFKGPQGREVVPASSAGGGGGGGGGGQSGPQGKTTTTYEWRDRYLIIREGVAYLLRSRDDHTGVHFLPFSHLMGLSDVEGIGRVLKSKMARSTTSINSNTGSSSTAGPPGNATSPSRSRPPRQSRGASATRAAEGPTGERSRKRRSSSLPRSSTSTAKDYRRGGAADTKGAVTQPSTQRSASTAKDNRQRLQPGPSKSASRSTQTEAGKHRKETDEEIRKRHEKEIEPLMHWDDLGFSLWPKKDKGKGKGKEGDKGKDADRGRDREKKGDRIGETSWKGKDREVQSDHQRSRGEHHSRHGRDRDRERDKEAERQRQQREQLKAKKAERTFIPQSKEEAEAHGMKIVCAKFRHLRQKEYEAFQKALAAHEPVKPSPVSVNADANDSSTPSLPKYTSTGPSLAGDPSVYIASDAESEAGHASSTGRATHNRNVFSEDQSSSSATGVPGPPRRPSLPALVGLLGASSPSVPSSLNLTAPSPATSSLAVHATHTGLGGSMGSASGASVAASSSAMVSAAMGAPKFMGGLFGRDRDKDKDKDPEERERRKEQKALEKGKKKAMKRDKERDTGDEDEGATSGAMNWKRMWSIAGPSSSAAGKMKERESLETAATATAAREDAPPSHRSVVVGEPEPPLNEEQEPQSRRSVSLPNLRDDTAPPPSSTRPKLSLSPIKDVAVPPQDQLQSPTTAQREAEYQELLDPAQQDEEDDSDSRSLSSPVFAHSDEEDLDDELVYGGSGSRRDRMGYRYGYQRKTESEDGALKGVTSTTSPPADPRAGNAAGPAARGDVAEVGGHARAREGDADPQNVSGTKELSQAKSMSTISTQQRSTKKKDDHEWVVLDMGSEHAYTSLVRILHRSFGRPLETPFVKEHIAPLDDAPTSAPSHPDNNTTSSPGGGSATPSTSNLNSPTQATFWSASSTLVGAPDAKSMVSDRTRSLRTADSYSSMHGSLPPPSVRPSGAPPPAGSDADDEDAHPGSGRRPEHPPILNALTLTKTKKAGKDGSSSAIHALPYPEWRIDVVQRARRHGMREAGRPLDLALHGWSSEFAEASLRERAERRTEEVQRLVREAEGEFGSEGEEGEGEEGDGDGEDADEEDNEGGSGDEEGSEDDGRAPARFDDDSRRMSAISHVSTLNAYQMNAAAAAALANRPPAHDQAQTFELDEECTVSRHTRAQAQNQAQNQDQDQPSPKSPKPAADDDASEYAYKYKYGREDEEDAIALGMESLLDDSDDDEDEESEMEWVAWIMDLQRQVAAREEKRRKREEERRRAAEASEAEAGAGAGAQQSQPLSVAFSNPFAQDSTHPPPGSESHAMPSGSAPAERTLSHYESKTSLGGSSGQISIWQSQEEERRLVVENRRMMEPTATSTFNPTPQEHDTRIYVHGAGGPSTSSASSTSLPPPPVPLHAYTSPRALFTKTPAQVLIQSETRVVGSDNVPLPALRRQSSRATVVSSRKSSESLAGRAARGSGGSGGAGTPVPPSISINVSSSSAGPPRSPQQASFSPESDAPSSSTTPPSASSPEHAQYQSKLVRANTHLRTPSASRMSRLYHSSSMPLGAAAAATATAGSPSTFTPAGGSVPSSPPKSAMRSASSTSPSTSTSPSSGGGGPTSPPSRASLALSYPVDKPILTPEQIHQIEAETELEMQQRRERLAAARASMAMAMGSSSASSSSSSPPPPASFIPRLSHVPIPVLRRANSASVHESGSKAVRSVSQPSQPSGSGSGSPANRGR